METNRVEEISIIMCLELIFKQHFYYLAFLDFLLRIYSDFPTFVKLGKEEKN